MVGNHLNDLSWLTYASICADDVFFVIRRIFDGGHNPTLVAVLLQGIEAAVFPGGKPHTLIKSVYGLVGDGDIKVSKTIRIFCGILGNLLAQFALGLFTLD